MRYKVFQKRNSKTKFPNNIRIFHEAIAIQVMLRTKGFEQKYMLMNLVIHLGNRVCLGWTLKGSHGYFVDEGENIQFSVIWVFQNINSMD